MSYVEADGIKWINNGPESDDHLSFGGHEKELEPFVFGLSSLQRAYLNVGAHVGTWALRMNTHAKLVYALEANQKTYETLCNNIALNAMQKRVNAFLMAAWDEDQVPLSFIDVNGKDTGGSTRVEEIDYLAATIFSRKLDTAFPPGLGYDFGLIQIDVEGAEAHVLRGATEILRADRPNLIIELHEGHPGVDPDIRAQVYGILDALGYSYHSEHVAGTEEHLIAVPAELEDYPAEV